MTKTATLTNCKYNWPSSVHNLKQHITKHFQARVSNFKIKSCSHLLLIIKILSVIIINNYQAIVNCQQLQLQQQTTTQYVQHNNIIYFDVFEGLPNNTYVGNIKSSDGQIPYLIVPWAPTPESERIQAFRVDLLNGDLYTNSVLDREHRELYHFIAIVKDPFWEIKCTVTVKDVNDNAPMFLLGNSATPSLSFNNGVVLNSNNIYNETNFVIELPEGQRGVRKVLPLAIDLDTPQYGIKEFRIVSGNTPSGTFQLVEHEAPARSSLAASLAQAGLSSLDDASSSISAVDNPRIQEQLNAQAVVLIPSQPQQQQQQQQLQQSLNLNQQLISQQQQQQLQQYSTSTSSNTFMQPASAIQQHQHQPQSSRYLIDVEVSQFLDRENQSSYQLVVEAIDGGQPPLIGRLLVTVNVQDANDNDPIFTKKVYECYVQENASKNTPLIRVQAFDADIDLNAQISYSIVKRSSLSNNQTTSLLFSTNNNTTATTSNQQSRTKVPSGSTSSTTSSASPSATSSTSSTSNGIRSFSSLQQQQQSASAELFDIDPIKGEIYLINSLDFEQAEVHEFFVEARDHGKPSRSSLALVKVFVNDVNDDPPPIQQQLPHLTRNNPTIHIAVGNSNNKSPNGSSSSSNQIPPQALNGGDYITRQMGSSADNESGKSSNYIQAILSSSGSWLAQIPSVGIFIIVLILSAFLFASFCFVKIRSSRKSIETDHYNDTAGLTLSPNGEQSKQSPNHSLSNHHHTPPDHHHHHHHSSLERNHHHHLPPLSLHQSHAGTPQHNSLEHSHHYHNHSPTSLHHHQSGVVAGHHHQHLANSLKHNHHSPSLHHLAGSTIQSSHNHHHHHSLEHHHHPSSLHRQSVAQYHSLEHHHSSSLHHNQHHNQSSGEALHQQEALQRYHSHNPHIHNHHQQQSLQQQLQQHHQQLQQQQHQQQQQQHQLQQHHNNNQNHQSGQHQHHREQVRHHSTSGCGGSGRGGQLPATPNSTHNSHSLTQSHTWLIGLAYAQDWCGSYNWDYLTDWTPQYPTIMELIK